MPELHILLLIIAAVVFALATVTNVPRVHLVPLGLLLLTLAALARLT